MADTPASKPNIPGDPPPVPPKPAPVPAPQPAKPAVEDKSLDAQTLGTQPAVVPPTPAAIDGLPEDASRDMLDPDYRAYQAGTHPSEMSPAELVASEAVEHTIDKGVTADGKPATRSTANVVPYAEAVRVAGTEPPKD